jgi:hypothetical protein
LEGHGIQRHRAALLFSKIGDFWKRCAQIRESG